MKRIHAEKRARQPVVAPVNAATAGTQASLREWIILGVVLVAGIGLRARAFSRSAVEHFDEGVYASNVYFPPPEFAYPGQKYYAPPLLPALIEMGMLVRLPPNLAALLPCFVAGCATIVAMWWVGRWWFGPRVGIAAATLVAISPFHVAYSAAALTDVLLGLWLVLAVDAAARSVVGTLRVPFPGDGTRSVPATYGDLRWAVGAGLYTGLAWWTKYNGWLPLAIEGAGGAMMLVFAWPKRPGTTKAPGARSQEPADFRRWLVCLAITCITAAALWAPYFWSLQKEGGYAPIAANHARYVVGFGGWLSSASRQIAGFSVTSGRGMAIGVLLAIVAAAVTAGRGGRVAAGMWQFVVLTAIGLVLCLAAPLLVLVVFSLAGFVILVRRSRADAITPFMAVGGALLSAWWLGLLIATPCYWPYPRLLLPWLLAAWLLAAVFIDEVVSLFVAGEGSGEDGARKRRAQLVAAIAGVSLLVVLPASWCCRPAPSLASQLSADRLSLVHAAKRIRAELDSATANASDNSASDLPRVVYVFGEPALLFQLCAAGEELVRPAQQIATSSAKLDGRDLPTFLIVGPHADRDPAFSVEWPAAKSHWRLVASYDEKPSAMVWLDLHDPRTVEPSAADSLRLYQFQP